jgi:DNA-binding LacI/PurR family transcriptional regulator
MTKRLKPLTILEFIVSKNRIVSPGEVEEATGIPPATITRVMARLTREGFLKKISHGRYALADRIGSLNPATDASMRAVRGRPLVLLGSMPVLGQLILGVIEKAFETLGVETRYVNCSAPGDEYIEIDPAKIKDAAGVFVFSPLEIRPRIKHMIEEMKVPLVRIGCFGHDEYDSVDWDDYLTYFEMTREFQKLGCPAVLYFGREDLQKKVGTFQARLRGYRDAMEESGLTARKALFGRDAFQNPEQVRGFARSVRETALSGPMGILLSHDTGLETVLTVLAMQGLDTEKNVLVGTVYTPDRAAALRDILPRLAVSALEPWDEIARIAAHRMHDRLTGDECQPQLSLVRPNIVVRKNRAASANIPEQPSVPA